MKGVAASNCPRGARCQAESPGAGGSGLRFPSPRHPQEGCADPTVSRSFPPRPSRSFRRKERRSRNSAFLCHFSAIAAARARATAQKYGVAPSIAPVSKCACAAQCRHRLTMAHRGHVARYSASLERRLRTRGISVSHASRRLVTRRFAVVPGAHNDGQSRNVPS